MSNEADRCHEYVFPRLKEAGWEAELHWLVEHRCAVTHLDGLHAKVDRLKALQAKAAAELDALLPSILDTAFKGEL